MNSRNYSLINSTFLTILIASLLQTSVHADNETKVGVIVQNETTTPVTVIQLTNGQNFLEISISTTDNTPLTIPANSSMVVFLRPYQTDKYTLSPVGKKPTYFPSSKSWISGNNFTTKPYLLKTEKTVLNIYDEDGIDN